MLYLFEDEYEFVSTYCENEKISMNRFFQDYVREQMKNKKNDRENKPYPIKFIEVDEVKPLKTVSEVKKVVQDKFTGLCPHGSMKGLCKKGC